MFRKVIYLMKKELYVMTKKRCFSFRNDGRRRKNELRNVFLCLSLCVILLQREIEKASKYLKGNIIFEVWEGEEGGRGVGKLTS
jgi:hypothetical protein